MDVKRVLEKETSGDEGDEDLLVQEAKRRKTVVNSVREAMGARYLQMHLPKLEPFLRRVVQEELQAALYRHIDLSPRSPLQIKSTISTKKRYQLLFENELPQTLFTNSRIETRDKKPVQILLFDTLLNQIITSGPLSFSKIEILVLDGDFEPAVRIGWTESEFNDCVVREREGKRPLLSGEVVITLTGGAGCVADVAFTDNSSWRRNRKFRLGARVYRNNTGGMEERVQEGVSNSFMVKDHRGESYKKHHPPALTDEVWRLEKIGKDGVFHKKLADQGINVVQDFLRKLVIDPDNLRLLLGNGMSNKMWEAAVEHAKQCVLCEDEKLYSYSYSDGNNGVLLLFNCIYELVGSVFAGSYCSLADLTVAQKALVDRVKQEAYKFPDRIIEFKEQAKYVRFSNEVLTTDTSQLSNLLDQNAPGLLMTNQIESSIHGGGFIDSSGGETLEDLSRIAGIIPVHENLLPFNNNSNNNPFETTHNSIHATNFHDIQMASVHSSTGLVFPSISSEKPTMNIDRVLLF